MDEQIPEENFEKLAVQLKCPEGEMGLEVAHMMNETNIGMTRKTIDQLKISGNDHLLEIGHGNAAHLKEIVDSTTSTVYYGLDISELMHREAQQTNEKFIRSGRASFHLYDGKKIPFPDYSFDKIITVNTLYFWEEPLEFLKEVYRVLKKGGYFGIAFGQKKFMEKLPFSKYGFQLYDDETFEKMVAKTDFKIENSLTQTEQVKSKTGDLVQREFIIYVMRK
ncbi:MAG TPA: class I SAM-dependent methyltransferase [Flavobacteriaceae bacterium]|nr:class I SAM-dependent methyltransferase [Flavobacteriaceae bacterium]